jgi:hypothetical protein
MSPKWRASVSPQRGRKWSCREREVFPRVQIGPGHRLPVGQEAYFGPGRVRERRLGRSGGTRQPADEGQRPPWRAVCAASDTREERGDRLGTKWL